MNINHEILSSRLKEVRTSLNLTQSAFAESIDISTIMVSSLENSVKVPSFNLITTIATKYNVSLDWLCGLSESRYFDNSIHTYSDLFRMLISILEYHYTAEDKTEVPIIHSVECEDKQFPVSMQFMEDENYRTFLTAWIKIFKLYHEGTIEKDLYELWLEKEYKKYDHPINGVSAVGHK